MMRILTIYTLVFFLVSPLFAWGTESVTGTNVGGAVFSADGDRGILSVYFAGFWATEDGGNRWTPINRRIYSSSFFAYTSVTSYDDNILRCVLRAYSIEPTEQGFTTWYTVDGGENWERNYQNLTATFFAFDRVDSTVYYRGTSGVFQRSFDQGANWETSELDFVALQPEWLYQDIQYPNVLYLCGYLPTDARGIIYRSEDRGENWTIFLRHPDIGIDSNSTILSFLPVGRDTLFIGYSNYYEEQECIARSLDGGQTWRQFGSGLPERSIPYPLRESQGILYTACSASGVYKSEDYGETWSQEGNGLPQSTMFVGDINVNRTSRMMYVSFLGGGVYCRHFDETIWHQIAMPEIGDHLDLLSRIKAHPGGISFLSYGSRLFTSENSSVQFQAVQVPEAESGYYTYCYPFLFDNGGFQACLRCQQSYYDEDNYRAELVLFEDHQPVENIELPFFQPASNTNALYALDNLDGVNLLAFHRYYEDTPYWTSTDTGRTWLEHEVPWVDAPNEEAIDGVKIAVITSSHELYVSRNFGESWEEPDRDFPDFGYDQTVPLWLGDTLLVSRSNRVYALAPDGTWSMRGELNHNLLFDWAVIGEGERRGIVKTSDRTRKILYSEDGGRTWNDQRIILPGEEMGRWSSDVSYDPYRERVWFGTSCGIVYMDMIELDAAEGPVQLHPIEFGIRNISPNPFNSETSIHYFLPECGTIKLSVYNLLGREIVRLEDEKGATGMNNILLKGDDLCSGTYFLRLDTPWGSDSRKITLLK